MEWKISRFSGRYSRWDEESQSWINGTPSKGDIVEVTPDIRYEYYVDNGEKNLKLGDGLLSQIVKSGTTITYNSFTPGELEDRLLALMDLGVNTATLNSQEYDTTIPQGSYRVEYERTSDLSGNLRIDTGIGSNPRIIEQAVISEEVRSTPSYYDHAVEQLERRFRERLSNEG